MTSIATNTPALRVHYHGITNQKAEDQATERLASGRRINQASDDAAGLFLSERIKLKIRGVDRAIKNSQDSIGLLSTAESAVDEIRNIILRMRELSVQMANGVYLNAPDRNYAQAEVDQLIQQIDMIANNANFNDVKLLDGSFQNIGIQSGHTAEERISLYFGDRSASGIGAASIDVTTQASALAAMETLGNSLAIISNDLSMMGAFQNRIGHNISALSSSQKFSTIAYGRIVDADMAEEATNLSKTQVLAQANAAMLAQSNRSLSLIMTLFN